MCASFLGILGGIGAGTGLIVDAARVERPMVGLGNLSAIVGLVFGLLNKEKLTVYVQKPRH